MIAIHKPKAPKELKNGIRNTKKNCSAFQGNSKKYFAGSIKFEFKNNVYNHKNVKTALEKAQHGKCCYCEARIGANQFGHVEHFRPKGAMCQDQDTGILYPGYYWLVYCWQNLYLSCEICNNRKRSIFPLSDPSRRARSHNDNLAQEDPLLLDPGGLHNPRDHIKFEKFLAKSNTTQGQTTIRILDLNREKLLDDRQEFFQILETVMMAVRFAKCAPKLFETKGNYLEKAHNYLTTAVKPKSKFSVMAADFIDNVSDFET